MTHNSLAGSVRRVWLLVIAAAVCVVGASQIARAAEPPAFEAAAEKLQAATVTVRVSLAGREPNTDAQESSDRKSTVTVCSGVTIGERLVVTSAFAAADSNIRITLPGGDQATAKLLVIDDYSGLALLSMDRKSAAMMTLNEPEPKVGSWVMSAAAWGAEDAVVSLGIVAGVNRMLEDGYPPLIQCDLRSDETSAGAGIVDSEGKLLGIVTAVDGKSNGRGWTYAVPARHVQRLLNARPETPRDGSAVILKRRRPTVGMVLESDEGEIVVRRIEPDSAAAKAGIEVGDRVLAADGVNIRSVYQAVRPVLHKQPGDAVEFLVARGDQVEKKLVVLEGGVELPSASLQRVAQFVRPNFQIERGDGFFVTRNGRGEIREVVAPGDGELEKSLPESERVRLLERAIERYLSVIVHLREELGESHRERLELDRKIESLQAELEELKTDVGESAER